MSGNPFAQNQSRSGNKVTTPGRHGTADGARNENAARHYNEHHSYNRDEITTRSPSSIRSGCPLPNPEERRRRRLVDEIQGFEITHLYYAAIVNDWIPPSWPEILRPIWQTARRRDRRWFTQPVDENVTDRKERWLMQIRLMHNVIEDDVIDPSEDKAPSSPVHSTSA